ncbi:phosphoribosylaminoimidazole carboxylase [Meredithblackwellia eburnea MCA 4105]
MALPIVVLDPDLKAPAKQVSQPHLISATANAPLEHLDGAFTDPAKIAQLADQVDVLTIEIEHVDVAALESVAEKLKSSGGRSGKGVKVYPAPSVIRIIQDKFAQKQHLASKAVPVAPFVQITASTSSPSQDPRQSLVPSILAAGKQFGYPFLLKSRHLAYDGRGNHVLRSDSAEDVQAAIDFLVPIPSLSAPNAKPLNDRLYAEKFAPFVKEVAVMVVRGVDGQTRTYPAVETIHRDNICHIVYAPLRPPAGDNSGVGKKQKGDKWNSVGKDVGERAREDAQKAIDALGDGAVGVFGVEMFLMADGSLFLNEIAPRPHNSGHYTIEACQPSQYTSHLFAILGLPLPPIAFIPPAAAMLNLLGATSSAEDDFGPVVKKAFEIGAAVHLYGKAGCRKGRKMGHITVLGTSDDDVRTKISGLVDALPEMYRDEEKKSISSSTLSNLLPSTARLPAPAGPFSSPNPLVSIVMGSDSDLPVMLPATNILSSFKIPFELSLVSAHRTPGRMVEFARTAEQRGVKVVVAGAGGAAHLPGMVASETTLPVIGVPVKGSTLDGVDSLYSIVQMPRGIPVATMAINNSTNAALLAVRILAAQVPHLRKELAEYSENLEEEVLGKIAKLEEVGWKDYVVKK